MYELWGRKRPIEGKGYPYEFIFSFDNEEYKYTAIDKLDGSIYEEAMIIRDNACILYVEFEKPYVYKYRR
jgi:hypothetical protein